VPRLRVTQARGMAGKQARQRATVRALGLKRVRHSVTHDDRPEIRGMIAKVRHLVTVEEVGE
jgi:large subunit ribosomal protein L30